MSKIQNILNSPNKDKIRLSPVAYYLHEFDESFYMDFHTHEYLEFMYCIQNSFTLQIYDSNNKIKNLVINEGEFVFLNGGQKHKLFINQNTKPLIANIEFAILFDNDKSIEKCINYSQFFINYLKDLYTTNEDYIILKDNHLVQKNLVNLITYLQNSNEKDYIHQSMSILSFFFSIKESIIKDKEGEFAFVRKAIQYIYSNLKRNLSVEEIANFVGKSPSYFAHKFKEDRGVSVLKYINNARVDKARFLLKNSSLSISNIAKEVGFKNKDQLNYQFRVMINCTPREYKDKIIYRSIENQTIQNEYHSIDYKY